MLRNPLYAIIGAIVAVLAIGAFVLYGMGDDGVHEARNPPAVLDKLRLTVHQIDQRGDRWAGRRDRGTGDQRAERRAGRGDRGDQGDRGDRGERRGRGRGVIQATWEDASGKRIQLADFRGRFVVLNLWATWCAPCITELPALARAQAALEQDNVVVIAVDLEKQDAATVAAFLKAHGAESLPVNIDKELALMRTFGAYALPLTILFDKDGREFARASGPQKWDDPEAVAYLKDMADVTAAPPERRGRDRGMRGTGGLFRIFRMFGHGH